MKKQIQVIANVNGHQSGILYGVGGVSPTIPAFTHGYALGWFLVKDNGQDNRVGELPQKQSRRI